MQGDPTAMSREERLEREREYNLDQEMKTYIVENNTGLLKNINRNVNLDNEEQESRNTASTHLNVREIVPHLWDD